MINSCLPLIVLVILFLSNQAVFAGSFFDFNEINAPKKKKAQAAAIDAYMDQAYGSDVSMGPRAEIGNSGGNFNRGLATSAPNLYLKNGKGKNSGVSFSFDESPISSFAVDSQIFKKGTGFLIKADGVIIYQHMLTKAEKKSGITASIDPIFFDKPIHTLEFVGVNNSKIAIDNLALNFTLPEYQELFNSITGLKNLAPPIAVAQVPEPSSLIMLGMAFLVVSWLSRQYPRSKRDPLLR
jgi:hypothetical protein